MMGRMLHLLQVRALFDEFSITLHLIHVHVYSLASVECCVARQLYSDSNSAAFLAGPVFVHRKNLRYCEVYFTATGIPLQH